MVLRFVDYKTAVGARHRNSEWLNAKDRLRPEVWPHVTPSFSLTKGATILTIGSCFARNIEWQFERIGFDVPSMSLYPAGQTSTLNKYTPPSMAQEIHWAASIFSRDDEMNEDDCEPYCYRLSRGVVIDNNLADFTPVTYDAFLDRRRAVYQVFRSAFRADCIILTPGLAEAWFDRERKIFIQRILAGHHSEISKNLQFVMLDFETCFRCLDDVIATVRQLNPSCKFLITTSPIPLERTFTNDDIIIANTHAKSVLRAACGEVVAKWDLVDYFPSFESVTLTKEWGILAEDLVHVGAPFINKIVNRTLEIYCSSDIGDAEKLFEAALSEPDLEKAIGYVQRAIELSPHEAYYRQAVASIYLRAGDYNNAILANDQACEFVAASGSALHSPEDKLMFRLQIYQKTGDLIRERDTLHDIVKLMPTSGRMYHRLGEVLWTLKDLDAAVIAFARAWDLGNCDQLAVGIALGTAWCRTNHVDDAIQLLQGMTEEWSGDDRVWTALGNAYLLFNRLSEAEEAFRRAMDIQPENEGAAYNANKLRERREGLSASTSVSAREQQPSTVA